MDITKGGCSWRCRCLRFTSGRADVLPGPSGITHSQSALHTQQSDNTVWNNSHQTEPSVVFKRLLKLYCSYPFQCAIPEIFSSYFFLFCLFTSFTCRTQQAGIRFNLEVESRCRANPELWPSSLPPEVKAEHLGHPSPWTMRYIQKGEVKLKRKKVCQGLTATSVDSTW